MSKKRRAQHGAGLQIPVKGFESCVSGGETRAYINVGAAKAAWVVYFISPYDVPICSRPYPREARARAYRAGYVDVAAERAGVKTYIYGGAEKRHGGFTL